MKETINEEGLSIYEFEDSERETSDKFHIAITKANAERYVIDRMIDGISQSVLKDLQSGSLSPVDSMGLDVDSPSNVLKVAVKFIANLVFESVQDRDDIWELAYQNGLPHDSDWSFDPRTRQFSREI